MVKPATMAMLKAPTASAALTGVFMTRSSLSNLVGFTVAALAGQINLAERRSLTWHCQPGAPC
jgi:hypothetical protein